MSQHKKNISVKCKILLKNICMIHSYLFLIRYLKFMLKRRTASAGFFSQSGTIKEGYGKLTDFVAWVLIVPYIFYITTIKIVVDRLLARSH
ncbi:hypothetical protein [Candidatus Tisiphia endosymbiont of Parasteatoda lunata]|uniref:hypothetical protein n=1 Tax=Candidatus Tisiphia endosymbiont of Parasteatoda lunata TaxID=3066275 RepID=UPI00313BC59C